MSLLNYLSECMYDIYPRLEYKHSTNTAATLGNSIDDQVLSYPATVET